MTDRLTLWNAMARDEAERSILPCCGSRAWASGMAGRRPFATATPLLEASREVWRSLDAQDWLEAFRSHPRIGDSRFGDSRAATSAAVKSQEWSAEEQRQVGEGGATLKRALAEGNRRYEERFGRTFIVCATGKLPDEILQMLRRRLQNNEVAELQEAAEEQQQITQIRLRKWLEE
jgi:2-oxo-4-hydroxy-4-carboxy-5-ureidoimidazoline decarboxylase